MEPHTDVPDVPGKSPIGGWAEASNTVRSKARVLAWLNGLFCGGTCDPKTHKRHAIVQGTTPMYKCTIAPGTYSAVLYLSIDFHPRSVRVARCLDQSSLGKEIFQLVSRL